MSSRIYTIGHSNHQMGVFIGLLQRYGITALMDVRSQPYSRYQPQFNKESLQQALQQAGIVYLFLGRELGARSENPHCYIDSKVQYELLAQEPAFKGGIDRVLTSLKDYCIALMCAEGDPLRCHRTILVGRELLKWDIELCHILPDGGLEMHQDTENRLLSMLELTELELFRSHEEIVADAYALQAQRIAYVDKRISHPV